MRLERLSATFFIGTLLLAGCSSPPATSGSLTESTPKPASVSRTNRPTPSPTPAQSPGTFRISGSMLGPRRSATAAALPDGRVLIAGGWGRAPGPVPDQRLATAELYDPAAGTSVGTGPMAVPREHGAVAVAMRDGRVLITGGSRERPWEAEIFDASRGQFTETGLRSYDVFQGFSATLLQDGRVLLAGGVPYLQQPVASAEVYDPVANSFTAVSSMTVAREGHSATLLADGRVLIAGGDLYTSKKPGTAELFDPGTSTFTRVAAMSSYRIDHRATLLEDGRVLISGGYVQVPGGDVWMPSYLATTELFDPRAGEFAPGGKMTEARAGHTASRLPGGRVLVFGGDGDPEQGWGGWLTSGDIYDPVGGSFAPTAPMTVVRAWPACAVLADGRVLLAGGEGEGLVALTSVEIYRP